MWTVNDPHPDDQEPTSCKLIGRSSSEILANIPIGSEIVNYCLPYNEESGLALIKTTELIPNERRRETDQDPEDDFKLNLILWDFKR